MKKILSLILVFLIFGTSLVNAGFEAKTNLPENTQKTIKNKLDNTFIIFETNLKKIDLERQATTIETVINKLDGMLLKKQSETNKFVLSYLRYLLGQQLTLIKVEIANSKNNKISCEKGYVIIDGKCIKDSKLCLNDEHIEGETCVNNEKSCTVTNGTGTQKWSDGKWKKCENIVCDTGYSMDGGLCIKDILPKDIECMDGFHIEGDTCMNNIRSCNIVNGVGTQEWKNGNWNSCANIVCNAGYEMKNGMCSTISSSGPSVNLDTNFTTTANDLYKITVNAGNENITLSSITLNISGAGTRAGTIKITKDNLSGIIVGSKSIGEDYYSGNIKFGMNSTDSKITSGTSNTFYIQYSDSASEASKKMIGIREIKITEIDYTIDSDSSNQLRYDILGVPTKTLFFDYSKK